MVLSIIYAVFGLFQVVTSAHSRSMKSFVHSQPRELKFRDLDWNPNIAQCPTQCAILVNAFTCTTSQCFCTNEVAASYRDCMVCSIDLASNPGLLSDAQQSQDDLTTNCESDGYPIAQLFVGTNGVSPAVPASDQTSVAFAAPPSTTAPLVGQTSTAFAAPPPNTNSQQPTSTVVVYPWQPSPTTVTNGNTVVWYGGSSFGMSVGLSTSYGQPPTAVGSSVIPGFQIGPSPSASASNTQTPHAASSASSSGASNGASLNPQEAKTSAATASHMIPILMMLAVFSVTTFSHAHML
ncbi:uncharacterized protein PHACADRAFT_177735 [Phanerochaete carnosa HHB-10118-sp]|uniref:Extracellular membrane protein CFEM domain-containing protein n=1 Tax=Phanerochaete carnosa (strain HHB-10118-sp) TaxID=650164 RepID=K5VWS0_PHACS|nr:uncharacterized protein PHACADRAFT_177735 [Phanerochaete carnosa HHB-10118-sp]EKM51044.1 hypothetical protein PHACADRAFT_177735 [Phanerochaete carnosa HHB-10118-sp]